MTPDVRLADVWRQNDPYAAGATLIVVQVCPDGCQPKGRPHAHVTGEAGERPRMIRLDRFRPTSRGYTLIERAGEVVA